MPSPIAIRSAAMLMQFAASSATISTPSVIVRLRENLRRISAPRLEPEASAIRSEISCTAIIIGTATGIVHSMLYE